MRDTGRFPFARPALAAAAAFIGLGITSASSVDASTDVPVANAAPTAQCPPEATPTSDPESSDPAASTASTPAGGPGTTVTDIDDNALTVDELVAELQSRMTGADASGLETCCVGPLRAEVDAVADCRVVNPGQGGETWFRYTLTGVDGSDIGFNLRLFIPRASLERLLPEFAVTLLRLDLEDVMCPDDLIGDVGTTLECVARSAGEERRVILTVTSIDGLKINFDIDVPSTN